MKLIVGLGNPGKRYAHTRHNAGFLALEHYARQYTGKSGLFKRGRTVFRSEKRLHGEAAEVADGRETTLLLKPHTFMNNSGRSVRATLDYYKLEVANILIVYDELALPLGTIRSRNGGESAGHNGIKSITAHLGSNDFMRLRIGISNDYAGTQPAERFVLSPFNAKERSLLPAVLDTAVECIDAFIHDELEADTFKIEQ